MDMASYVKKKGTNTVTLQRLGKNVFQLVATRYDVDTAEEADPEVQQFTIADIDKTIEQATKERDLIQKRIDNLNVLKQDMITQQQITNP